MEKRKKRRRLSNMTALATTGLMWPTYGLLSLRVNLLIEMKLFGVM